GEAVRRKPLAGALVDDVLVAEKRKCCVVERISRQCVEQSTEAGENAVAATTGQRPRKHLEDTSAIRGAALQRRLDHRQLVMVGEQSRAGHTQTSSRGAASDSGGRGGDPACRTIRMTPTTTASVDNAERIVNGSLRIVAPRITATTGLTNAYVVTSGKSALRSSHTYAV